MELGMAQGRLAGRLIDHHANSMFSDDEARVLPGSNNQVEVRPRRLLTCIICGYDANGELKAGGKGQSFTQDNAMEHLNSEEHHNRVYRRGAQFVEGAPLMIPSVNPELQYRCRPCGLDHDGTIHIDPRHWQMKEAGLQAHLTSRDHLRRASDGRLGTHVIRVMLNQAVINEAQEAAQAAAAAQAALQAAAAAQAAPQGEGQAAI